MAGIRTSQLPFETLLTNEFRNFRASQFISEVIISDVIKPPKVRASQLVAEVIILGEVTPTPTPTPTPTASTTLDSAFYRLILLVR